MIFIAILLGLIEGLTEFIPVSSTGHLILFGDLLGFRGPGNRSFEVVIQLGAICAVCWLYRKKIASTAAGVVCRNPQDMRFATGIVIAVIPAIIFGVLFHDYIKQVLFNPLNVSIVLILGGFIILFAERFRPAVRYESLESLTPVMCLKIGICQCFALIPGTSRSGATIIGAMLMGVDRKAATEFSFFLAIPTMLAATSYELITNGSTLGLEDIELIAAGFLAAFFSAMLVVKMVVAYISRHGFAPFAYYRIALGCVMLLLLM